MSTFAVPLLVSTAAAQRRVNRRAAAAKREDYLLRLGRRNGLTDEEVVRNKKRIAKTKANWLEKQEEEITKQSACGGRAVELANYARSNALDAVHAGIALGVMGVTLRKLRYLWRRADQAFNEAYAAYTAACAAY